MYLTKTRRGETWGLLTSHTLLTFGLIGGIAVPLPPCVMLPNLVAHPELAP